MASQVEKLEDDVHIKASPKQFHDIYYNKTYHIANICPDKVQRVDLVEGKWGIEGSTILWHYDQDGKSSKSKDLLEAVDIENSKATLKVLEGDTLTYYKSMRFITHATPHEEGSVVHWTLQYEKLRHDDNNADQYTRAMMKLAIELTKDIDNYLATHPDEQ